MLAAHECTLFDKRRHVSANVRPNHVVWFGLLRSLAEKHRSREAQLSTAATASIRDALRTSFGDGAAFALPYALGTDR